MSDHQSEQLSAILFDWPSPDNLIGFGLWRLLNEVVGNEVKEASSDVAYSLRRWSQRLACSEQTVSDYFSRFQTLGLITVTLDDDDLHRTRVKIHNLARYADEWTRRKAAGVNERRRSRRAGNTSGTGTEQHRAARRGSPARKKAKLKAKLSPRGNAARPQGAAAAVPNVRACGYCREPVDPSDPGFLCNKCRRERSEVSVAL